MWHCVMSLYYVIAISVHGREAVCMASLYAMAGTGSQVGGPWTEVIGDWETHKKGGCSHFSRVDLS